MLDIGSRRELFVDDCLIDKMSRVELQLHHPTPKQLAIVHDEPWEGNSCGYHSVFRDGDVYRMYYHAWAQEPRGVTPAHDIFGAYAESTDGIHWQKPELGLFEFDGSKKNNLIWIGEGAHDFAAFKDTNPNAERDARYKVVACGGGGLMAFKAPDGIHWSRISDKPVMTRGAFDTNNVAFWDSLRGEYRAYVRDFRDGLRDIRTATSNDFVHWTDPVWLKYPGAPREQLYTNQIVPYYRAPHIFLGFPARYTDRGWSDSMRALPQLEERLSRSEVSQRFGTALTDGLFMTSRDGRAFRRWGEAFLRPGLSTTDNWCYGDNYQCWGIVETKSDAAGMPDELSVYATEHYWRSPGSKLRRFTLRIDGFVSVQAALRGGEFVTRPFKFSGRELEMNFATSVAGSVRVETRDAKGKPIPGFTLRECPDIFGDDLSRVVKWKGGTDVSKLAGKPVRLRFVMKDADLYSIRFRP